MLGFRYRLRRSVRHLGARTNAKCREQRGAEAVIFPIEDIFKLSIKEREQANIGALLFGIRDQVDQLIAIRKYGRLLDGEFGELMAIRQKLEWLLSDIKETTSN
jgi:hypothetical protein